MSSQFPFVLVPLILLLPGCNKSPGGTSSSSPPAAVRYLYVASGACYGGGVATSTGSDTIAKYQLPGGSFVSEVADYNALAPGDNPVAMADYSDTELLVAVENTSGRRFDLVDKDGNNVIQTYLVNSTALSGVLRDVVLLGDGSLLVSKSTAVEEFSPSKGRITEGANPFINAPASPCATSTTLISGLTTLSNGKVVYSHAAASPNNKLGMISATGYASAADCLASQAAPTTTAMPTGLLVHSSGRLFVSYGSTTFASNLVYSYAVDGTANTISNATLAYSDSTIVNGPSAMIEDTSTGDIYIANALGTMNTIEHFTEANGVLTRVGSMPFLGSTVFTRCISSLLVSDH